MKLSSLTLSCHSAAQAVLLPMLVYLGFGAWGAVLGYTLASVISGAFAIYLAIYENNKKAFPLTIGLGYAEHSKNALELRSSARDSLDFCRPPNTITSLVMASSVEVGIIGNYRIATNFAALLNFVIFR